MLDIYIPPRELYDEDEDGNVIFLYPKGGMLHLEHSLISLSKWEMKWGKPYLDLRTPKTREESIDYVRCMTVGKELDALSYASIADEQMDVINDYIGAPMTATWFAKTPGSGNGRGMSHEIITNELIYYWMIQFQIPFECEKWHLNRLMTLIRVCNIKQAGPGKKMSKRELMERNTRLNAERKARLKTKG